MLVTRLQSIVRMGLPVRSAHRGLATTRAVMYAAPSEAVSGAVQSATASVKPAPAKIVYTRKSSVRSALFGLFFGATFASIFGASYLVEEIQKANSKLLSTVNDLYSETEKVRGYLKRITELENEIKELQSQTATHNNLHKLREDMRKLYDQVSREQLSLRAQLRDVELDVNNALKNEGKGIQL
ncbi:hypothetical protein H4R34_001906 [Dimargaris verticillata]|uniref:Uncharacterized protein n=1 Tax=Dimargaris verticillata TaxID=2761393 RepID=A0A9W8B3S2_9FUNG|nr:hypothetical protein H4R34_001906 [Dimargaris verticillata]